MIGGIELSGYESGKQTSDGCANLMAAGGEPLTYEADDLRVNAGQLLGQYEEVRLSELAAFLLRFVMPCNSEKVQGIDIPQTYIAEFGADLLRNESGILHLGKGGENDVSLARTVNILLQHLFIFG